jgi:hypothetical protein
MLGNSFKGHTADNTPNYKFKLPKFDSNLNTLILFKNLPFIFFLAFLGVIYIANANYGERLVRRINESQEKLKRVGWESNAIKSELMYRTMQSEIADEVDALGLKELKERPYLIKTKTER